MLEGASTDTHIYIAGPMSGYPNYNYDAFFSVEDRLRRGGYTNINNPAKHFNGKQDLPWEQYLSAAIQSVMESEAIIVLPGWTHSPGARLEIAIATVMGHVTYSAVRQPSAGYEFVLRNVGEAKPMVSALLGMSDHPLIPPTDDKPEPQQTQQTKETQMPHEEAASLVHGARQSDYGHPFDNYTRLSMMWNGLLDGKLKPGLDGLLTPEDCVLMLAAMKLVRQTNKPKRDNIVDTHGYLMVHEMIDDERQRRAQEK